MGFFRCVFSYILTSVINLTFQDHDDPILSHLQDIKVKFTENPVVSCSLADALNGKEKFR